MAANEKGHRPRAGWIRRPVSFTSPEFCEASEFARSLGTVGPGLPALRLVVTNRGAAVRTALLALRLPHVEFRLSDDTESEIRQRLVRRTAGLPTGRLARAVLELPVSEEEYLRGRQRQAMRTNVRRARALGISCRNIPDVDERAKVATKVVTSRHSNDVLLGDWLDGRLESGEFFAAVGHDGTALAFASVAVDTYCSFLKGMISSQAEEASPARYLLLLHLVVELGHSGVRYLLADSALQLPAGLQYFQHLAGFTAVNVQVRRATMRTRRRTTRRSPLGGADKLAPVNH